MTLVNLIAVSLATWQAVEIWRHSELLSGWRCWVESWKRTPAVLTCPWCLSPWVAAVCILLLQSHWISWIVFALAASRLANIGNDTTYDTARTPKAQNIVVPEDDVESK